MVNLVSSPLLPGQAAEKGQVSTQISLLPFSTRCLIAISNFLKKTLPKALRTQASTALPSNLVWIGGFGLVGLAQEAWVARFGSLWQV